MLLKTAAPWGTLPQRKPSAVRATWQQQRPQGPPASSQLDPSALTRRIVNASSTLELLQLHAAHRSSLDAIHVAALFNKLLSVGSTSSGSNNSRTASSRHAAQQVLPQQQRLYQQQQHPEQHRRLVLEALLADLPSMAHVLQPGPVAVILRALAKLEVQPEPQLLLALLHRAHVGLGFRAFSPRELCTVATALAELQPVKLPWVAASATCGSERQQQGQQLCCGAQAAEHQAAGSSGSSNRCVWEPVLLQELFFAFGSSLQRCNAQDAAQAVLAAARLQYAPSEAWMQLWLLRAKQLLPRFTPQGLANAAYGLVRVLQLRGELASSSSGGGWVHRSKADNSSSSSGKQTGGSASILQQQPQQQQGSNLLVAARTWLQSCLQVCVLHLSSLKPQELIGQLLWAAGKLGVSAPEPAGHHLLAAAQAMLPACDARHLVAAMYAFALLNFSLDQGACGVLWSSLASRVQELSSRDLDQVLWSAAQLQLQPPRWLRNQLQQRALLLLDVETEAAGLSSSSSTQAARHTVGVLRGMVSLGWKLQDRYLVRCQGLLQEVLPSCVPQDYANMLWAFATAGARLEARWLDRVLLAAYSELDRFNPQELCNTLWALALLQHSIPKPWMQQLLLVCLQQLSQFKPADHSQLLGALCKLSYTPSPLWLSTFWAQSGRSLADVGANYTATQLHTLLLASAGLQLQPPQRWVQAAAGAVERGLSGFLSQQLLEVLRALQQLQRASIAAVPGSGGTSVYSTAGSSSGSSGSSGVRWSSSLVPLSGSSMAGTTQSLQLRFMLPPLTAASNSSSINSSGNSSSVRPATWSPGMIRLYRQLALQLTPIASPRLVRPVWPVASRRSSGSSGDNRVSGSSSSGSSAGPLHMQTLPPLPQQQQQHQHPTAVAGLQGGVGAGREWEPLAAANADEAYSLACLVLLMPPHLHSKMERWPQLLAAGRAHQQQQQQQKGSGVLQLAQ